MVDPTPGDRAWSIGGRTMGVAGLVGIMVLVGLVGAGEAAKPPAEFRLQDHRGAWHTLDEARDRIRAAWPASR